ncbi:DUF2059 domain-containing protein [Nostoc sp. MG11]|uniref:DUF2059 domain-containing protein n=1 Tax=Nostoc sp. MG11 TaxID=2721166 RepID=UPI001868906D|nr:DUF2059 domain-containing protein [Nostoc sp. MG11]
MKIKLLVSAVVLSIVTIFNGVAFSQIPKNPTAPTTNTQEIEKTNNIRQLLKITGSENLSRQIMLQLVDTLKPQYPQVPQKAWDTFLAELKPNELMNELIPVYAKYFTNEEIKQMIAFYETPLGKKTISVLPQISQESAEIGQKYGIAAAKRALQKLEAEGYLRRRP